MNTSTDPKKIKIFDTTLRDGEQSPGASMNLEEKLRIAEVLEEMGVDVIEAGFPIASNGDFEAVCEVAKLIKNSVVCGLARSGRTDIERAAEALKPGIRTRIHTFISTSALHMKYKLQMEPDEVSSNTKFLDYFYSERGQELLKRRVTLLHCTSEYPAPVDQLNLHAIETLRKTFGLKIGYSDHSEGIFTAVAAAALGSVVIEKHFTLDKELEGPDHQASLVPEELCQMVKEIRKIQLGLGDGVKKPTTSELITQQAVRKSLYARIPIKVGELFTEHNLTAKRPQNGISPMEYWRILGTVSTISYAKDERIR